MAAPPHRPATAGIAYRRAGLDDLVACAGIWRDSINDYTRRLNQPDIPDDLAAILRLYAHLHATDPDGFVVAEQAVDGGPPVVVAFVASVRREDAVVPVDAVRPARRPGRAGSVGRCSRR